MSEINFLSSSDGDKKKPKNNTTASSVEVEFHAPESKKMEPSQLVKKITGWVKRITTKDPRTKKPKQKKQLKEKESNDSLHFTAVKPSIAHKKDLGVNLVDSHSLKKEKEKTILPNLKNRSDESKKKKKKPERPLPTPVVVSKKPHEVKEKLTRLKNEKPIIAPEKSKVSKPVELDDESASGDIGVNLMPWQDPSIKRKRVIRWVVILVAVGVIVVWGTIVRVSTIGQETNIAGLEERIATLDYQLNNIDAELLAQGSTLAINQKKFLEVYNEMPLWTKFLTWLENNTDKSVYYTQIKVTGEQKVFLETRARDYNSAARQWLTFQTATSWISSVGVSEFVEVEGSDTSDGTYVEFSVELDVSSSAIRQDSDLLDL